MLSIVCYPTRGLYSGVLDKTYSSAMKKKALMLGEVSHSSAGIVSILGVAC